MITLDDTRRMALALPKTAEHTHYRLPAFQVDGKTFVVVRANKSQALLYLSEAAASAEMAKDPALFEEERKPGRPYGLWVDMAAVTSERFEGLLELAWRGKAPKQLINEYDSGR